MTELMMTRKELALRWNCGVSTLKRKEKRGLLTALRIDRRLVRYRMSQIIEIERNAARAEAESAKK
jgi:hypothetical protein